MENVANSTNYTFDGFFVDMEKRLLRGAEGGPIPLTPKAFDTLYYLVSHAGQVIEKDELMSAIWQDTIVEENNLNKNISTLRRVLGENPGEHRFIATVPGKGYKFVATVSEARHGAEEASAPSQIDRASVSGRFWLLTILAGVLLAAGLVFFYTGSTAPSTERINSVAVLPFINVGGDPELEYLSEGLSENLIDRLSELPQLAVIARTSSFKFRDENPDVENIARKLGVQAVVTGRVSRRGDNLSIRVEVVDARSNKHLWGESFERKIADALVLEGEIARAISSKLNLELSGEQSKHLDRRGTNDPRAYEMLLRGDFLARSANNWPKAIESYQEAVMLDPSYALAYARLANLYGRLGGNSILDPNDTRPKGLAAAQRAVELDNGLAEAHLELANFARDAWDWKNAEREYRLTLQLNPSHSKARVRFSTFLANLGRYDEAIAEAFRTKELDPEQLSSRATVPAVLTLARRFDEAIAEIESFKEFVPTSTGLYAMLGLAYSGKGMHREAIAAHNESIRLGNKFLSNEIFLGAAYARAGDRKKAREILRRMETATEYVSPAELSVLHVALGDREAALATLEKAYAAHDLQLQYLKVDVGYDPLRSDPRFHDLINRVGLPQ